MALEIFIPNYDGQRSGTTYMAFYLEEHSANPPRRDAFHAYMRVADFSGTVNTELPDYFARSFNNLTMLFSW